MIAKMLQYDGNQENLECEGRQVVVQEKRLLHQEEGQVIHSPASNTDAPGWYPELPHICRRHKAPSQSTVSGNLKALRGHLLAWFGLFLDPLQLVLIQSLTSPHSAEVNSWICHTFRCEAASQQDNKMYSQKNQQKTIWPYRRDGTLVGMNASKINPSLHNHYPPLLNHHKKAQ